MEQVNTFLTAESGHQPGKGLNRQVLQVVFFGRNAPGAPFVGIVQVGVSQQANVTPVHTGKPSDFGESPLDALIDLFRSQGDEPGGNRPDDLVEFRSVGRGFFGESGLERISFGRTRFNMGLHFFRQYSAG